MKRHSHRPRWYPLVAIAVICALIGFSIFTFRARKARDRGVMFTNDIARLAQIFQKIDATAGIAGFDFPKNEINFLNIKKDGFIGSEIGSMNLIRPARWEGPYIDEITSLQEQNYMVVRTDRGYFITPRDGVRLPNGKVIGQDIIIDENSDIESMMQDNALLAYNGSPLAARIMISGSSALPPASAPVEHDLPEGY
ncbi:MAG: hypothetical protein AMXMBFR12_07680 [Candidatus Babeliales bacterium]